MTVTKDNCSFNGLSMVTLFSEPVYKSLFLARIKKSLMVTLKGSIYKEMIGEIIRWNDMLIAAYQQAKTY